MAADRAPFDDLAQKAEAGDAEAQFQLGQAYDEDCRNPPCFGSISKVQPGGVSLVVM